jgi:hypothetical protein
MIITIFNILHDKYMATDHLTVNAKAGLLDRGGFIGLYIFR